MPRLLHYSDSIKGGFGATIRLDSGEPCLVSVAQSGVRVRKSRFGFFGAILFEDTNVTRAAKIAIKLADQFGNSFPAKINNPVLAAFANFLYNCKSCSTIAATLDAAALKVGTER